MPSCVLNVAEKLLSWQHVCSCLKSVWSPKPPCSGRHRQAARILRIRPETVDESQRELKGDESQLARECQRRKSKAHYRPRPVA